ncbi:MAG: DNA polymerase III subunit alpha [Candidatus Omnitrophica bacterium]|nr:DNA polymerase III subunit alpha [Candidatus Omnitrophota bacterium]
MPHKNFVHLHVHSQYSLLDGACKIPELISRSIDLGFPAIAITDHGSMFGIIEFVSEARKQGIKPIIGIETYVAPGSRFDKASHGIKEASFHLVLLACNEQGYKNLMKLSSIGYLEGFYYKPRVDREVLKTYSEGIIALSACLQGEAAYYVLNDQMKEAEKTVRAYCDIFGIENFFLEVQDHGLEEQKKINQAFLKLNKSLGVNLVATNDIHYLYKKDSVAHDALLAIQTGTTLSDPNRLRFSTDQFYLRTAEEMESLFKGYPGALENTVRIAERCNVELDFDKTYLPEFTPPGGKSKEQFLEELCEAGLIKRHGTISEDYAKRLDFELKVINSMNYTSYFLIVWDFIRFARESKIAVGPGRGSAAGSLVAFALGITDIDPIKHCLLFERFLNPDRVSMPDIDIDFCYERRDEVINYVTRKYGQDNVAQIITFGTMAARGVIRDVGRVMSFSYQEVDKIAKMIPEQIGMTIEQALKVEPRFKEMMAQDQRVGQLIEVSKALEGLARHASTHAAGVVISNVPLTEHCPLFKQNDQVTTQYSMTDLEKIGLLKMDFLGLRTLTVIDETVKILKRTRGIGFDIHDIPFDDEKTFELLGRGESPGVFQLESSGMRDLLKKMRPKNFEDIVALLALYRPGPLGSGMVDDFIRRKHNPSLIKYDHPALEPILKETYGVILYQEQVMQIVSNLAGFSLAKADSLRRAIGKKEPEIMEREKRDFIEGCRKNHVYDRVAEKIWGLIEYFSGYGFNKSHSAAYSFISYQTAYLKANFTIEFMTALLTSEKDKMDKVVQYIDEAKRLGIELLPPSLNESFSEFTCNDKTVRFGLSAVKNVGSTAIESILAERLKDGPFASFYDFTKRVDLRVVNRKVLESLIKCGAFDCFGLYRSQLMAMIDHALQMGSSIQRDRSRGQFSFFETFDEHKQFKSEVEDVPKIEEWAESQLLAYEREMLGFYVTAHPLTKYEKTLKTYASMTTDMLSEGRDQQEVTIGGIIEIMKEILTRKGDKMAFVTIEDLKGRTEVVVFPDLYRESLSLLQKDATVFIRGRLTLREDEPKIIASEILPLSEAGKRLTRVVSIDLFTAGLDKETLEKLRDILITHKGKVPVYLNFKGPEGDETIISPSEGFLIETSSELFDKIEKLLGENVIHIKT